MKITVNKEQMAVVGKAGLKIGKAIIIEGTKAVVGKGVMNVAIVGLEKGKGGIKNMSLDDVIGKKQKVGFKELFKKRKTIKVSESEVKEALAEAVSAGYEAGVEDTLKGDKPEA